MTGPSRERVRKALQSCVGSIRRCLAIVLHFLRGKLGDWKDAASTLQSVLTVAAIVVGGWWTWHLFDPIAQTKPNLFVEQLLSARKLGDGLVLLDATFFLHNTGRVTLFVSCADFWLRRILPLTPMQSADFRRTVRNVRIDDPTINWPVLKWARVDFNKLYRGQNFLVEAGGEAPYDLQLIIPETIDSDPKNRIVTVSLYSDFQMARSKTSACRFKKDGGIRGPDWPTTTLYDLPK